MNQYARWIMMRCERLHIVMPRFRIDPNRKNFFLYCLQNMRNDSGVNCFGTNVIVPNVYPLCNHQFSEIRRPSALNSSYVLVFGKIRR